MICKNCNRDIPDSSIHCPICGNKINTERDSTFIASSAFRPAGSLDDGDSSPVATPTSAPAEQPPSICDNTAASSVIKPAKYTSPVTDARIEHSNPSKVCNNCGFSVETEAKFCPNCGKTLVPPAPQRGLSSLTKVKGNKSLITMIGIGVGAVAVIAIIVGIVSAILSGFGPEATVEKGINALKDGNAKAIINMMHPDILDAMLDETDMDKDDLIERLEDDLEDAEDQIEDMEWEIRRVKQYNKNDDEYEDMLDYLDEIDVDIQVSGVAKVTMSVEYKGYKQTEKVWLIKSGIKWYLFNDTLA